MLIDTHCHLDFKDFNADRADVIKRAGAAGVSRIINVGSSKAASVNSVRLAREYDAVYAAVGIHPHDAASYSPEEHAFLKDLAGREEKVIAIGEVGLDYYRNLSPKEVQREAFKGFIRMARELDLPLIIHSRSAMEDTLKILKEQTGTTARGVMHCFSGDRKQLEACLSVGLHISFTCNVTFKKADLLKETVKRVPTERLLIETDAPFLAPEGRRGKRNEPAYIIHLVEELARLYGLSALDIARITTMNACRLFSLPQELHHNIAYPIRDSLYLNITNRCTSDCAFCTRNISDYVRGHNLRLDHEPSAAQILEEVKAAGKARYKEVAFCGFGEPTLRLDVIKEVAAAMKAEGMKVRLVTNGHGAVIHSRPIARELKGCIDKVSVSLNADSADAYNNICRPLLEGATFSAVLSFIGSCVKEGIETEVTCVTAAGVDIKKCESLVKNLGASFRLRTLHTVG